MKQVTALIILLTSLSLSTLCSAATSSPRQSQQSIIAAVKQFLQSQSSHNNISRRSVSVGYLDKRLNLHQCRQALQTFLAPGAKTLGKTTVGVRCNDDKPWSLYVAATVNGYANVLMTRHNIDKGQIFSDADIVAVERNLADLSYGYFIDKQTLIGKASTRRLNRDLVITPNHVKDPILIKRGEQVALIAKANGFSVRMNGKAMMNGTKGQLIRVKNLSSKRVIEGRVIRTGEVAVLN